MPVLMIALVSLIIFGAIGVLLFTAVLLERHAQRKEQEPMQLHSVAGAAKH
jgi:hypothetical protein